MSLESLGKLSQLTQLDIGYNLLELNSLQPLSQLTMLQSLEIGLVENMPSLDPIGSLVRLTRLHLHLLNPASFSFCSSLQSLRQLRVTSDAMEQNDLVQLSQLNSLEKLAFQEYHNNSCTFLSALAGLTDMTYLVLTHESDQPIGLPGLSLLTQLQSFHCNVINWLDYAQTFCLEKLTQLRMSPAPAESLQSLTALRNLQAVHFDGCKVTKLPDSFLLQGLTHLQLLDTALSSVQPLVSLTQLQELYLGFKNLRFPACSESESVCGEIMGHIGRLPNLCVLWLYSLPTVDLALLNSLGGLCGLGVCNAEYVEFEQCTLQWDMMTELAFHYSPLHNPPEEVTSVAKGSWLYY